MAIPQDPRMNQAIDSIASNAMGVPPVATPAVEKPKDTTADKVAAKGSPETEADKMTAEAIIYEVDFGDTDKEGNKTNRKLTPQQIKSTFDRYSAMNYKNAQYKPVMDVIESYMKANPNASPSKVAEELTNIVKAGEPNAQFGRDADTAPAKSNEDLSKSLSKWEEDNAASLPPGYKEMMLTNTDGMSEMKKSIAETQKMLQMVLANSQGVADAGKAAMEVGNTNQINAVRQQIGNNIDRVQQSLGLPDSAADDFMLFAAERGFTMEDFVDPAMTLKVMTDFKNNMNSPEMERMKAIASRRQAYTGSLGSTPNATASVENPAEQTTFDKMMSGAMNQKGLV
tara:strand:- start:31 stop:1053 length:1023 start_codon:yes stop_codon:yes gene_type:complete